MALKKVLYLRGMKNATLLPKVVQLTQYGTARKMRNSFAR